MGNEDKTFCEASQELSPEMTMFSELFISIHKEDSQLDFSEQLHWGIQKSNSLIFPQIFWLLCAEGNKAGICKWTK